MNATMLLPLALTLAAVPVDNPPVGDDRLKMQGTWTVVSLTTGGERASAEDVKGARFTVKGNQFTFKSRESYEGTFTLDPTGRPKQIDSTFVDREGKETGVARGIYQFEGDRLTICWAEVGSKERPRDFSSPPKSGNRLIVLEKARGR